VELGRIILAVDEDCKKLNQYKKVNETMFKTMSSANTMVLYNKEHAAGLPPAQIIHSESEAIDTAIRLATTFSQDAATRDRARYIPPSLLDEFSQTGLWAITVPKEYGGADVSHGTVTAVFAILAEADPSLAQIPQNHFNDIDTIKWAGDDRQKRFFFAEALNGARFGNAFAEIKNTDASSFECRLSYRDGNLLLNGRKFYATGALMAHWVQVGAIDDNGLNVLAFVRRDSTGLTVIDDWSGFGQRTTASGTVILDNVIVEPLNVIQAHRAFSTPTTNGPLSQLIHASIDLGISRAAIKDTIEFVTTQSRPWTDAQVEKASDDPLTVVQIGDLEYRLHAAEALLERAARVVDSAAVAPTEDSVAQASIAVAEAKIATTEIAIFATNKLFELAGTKSTLERFALDRHWRNARTHTLHDPVRWKYHAVGNYYLNHRNPARHGWL
jgi:SfnB family sulfur acquisition oxidoreductase